MRPRTGEADGTHVLAYVKRRVVHRAGDASRPLVTRDGLLPVKHDFGEDWLWRRYARGERMTVWLFSCLRLGRTLLAPALDARIRVAAGAQTQDWPPKAGDGEGKSVARPSGYAFVADRKHSCYLPWADATSLLYSLRFVSARAKQLAPDLRQTPNLLPRHFQRSRLLTAGSVGAIAAFTEDVCHRPRAFVSYRWEDGTYAAAKVVARLSGEGYACWWDRWGMARAVVERKADLKRKDVETVICAATRGCSLAVIVDSPGYGESDWTRWERDVLAALARAGRIELRIVGDAR